MGAAPAGTSIARRQRSRTLSENLMDAAGSELKANKAADEEPLRTERQDSAFSILQARAPCFTIRRADCPCLCWCLLCHPQQLTVATVLQQEGISNETVSRKVHWHIMPRFCLLTVLNHMDRANLASPFSFSAIHSPLKFSK